MSDFRAKMPKAYTLHLSETQKSMLMNALSREIDRMSDGGSEELVGMLTELETELFRQLRNNKENKL
jgi:hypothetical protein